VVPQATLGRDPLTGKRSQVTRRGFRTAAEAGRARQELLSGDGRTPRPSAVGMTLDELLDLYLDGLDAESRRREGGRNMVHVVAAEPKVELWVDDHQEYEPGIRHRAPSARPASPRPARW
jgi:Arm DNA-binding domain